jgi:uncharacterized repeat protein (TIGR01451 family)
MLAVARAAIALTLENTRRFSHPPRVARVVLVALGSTLMLFAGSAPASTPARAAVVITMQPYPTSDTLAEAWSKASGEPTKEPVVVDAGHTGAGDLLGPVESFEGIGNDEQATHAAPPDPEGDVGQDLYVQWVNTSFAIYSKSGRRLLGPVPGSFLWRGLGPPCETTNLGDPIVLYDELSARWLLAQYAVARRSGRYFECLALSNGSDPTGSYTRYLLEMPERQLGTSRLELFNDYTKLGVWSNAYVMTDVEVEPSSNTPLGAGVFALERSAMLAGEPAAGVYLDLPGESPVLPSDLDGRTLPPGDPLLVQVPDAGSAQAPTTVDDVTLRRLHPVFGGSPDATFGPEVHLRTAAAFQPLCPTSPRQCIEQPGTSTKLDALADRPMFRAAYRSFGPSGRLVVLRTVGVGSPARAGLRWDEIVDTGTSLSLKRARTYAPDAASRWTGSAAMDARGDIGLGFSTSNASSYPSIGYSGVRASDETALGEGRLAVGGAAQTESSKWGDYSSLSVDPVDRCSFWYTHEYYPVGRPAPGQGETPWHTRIGSFRFAGCGATPGVDAPAGAGAREGATVTADPGDWADVPGVTRSSLTYEWRRCGADGGGCAGIPGATGSAYRLTSSDVDSTIRVAVRASSPVAGVASALSAPTAVVKPIPAAFPVELAAVSAAEPRSAVRGGKVAFTVRVSNQSDEPGRRSGTATDVVFEDTPPPGSEVVSATADRGPGCDTRSRPVRCPLDFLPAGRTATVVVAVRPVDRGTAENVASVSAAQCPPPCVTTTAAAQVVGAPVLRIVTPARLGRGGRGGATVSARIAIDEPATVTAALRPNGSTGRLPLLRGSRLGGATLRKQATSIALVRTAAGEFGLALRVARGRIRRDRGYVVSIEAVDRDGQNTRLELRISTARHA